MTSWPWPWEEPHHIYQSECPEEPVKFEYEGVKFRVEPTGGCAFHSGRATSKVICLVCKEEVTPETTSPAEMIKMHLKDKHWEGMRVCPLGLAAKRECRGYIADHRCTGKCPERS